MRHGVGRRARRLPVGTGRKREMVTGLLSVVVPAFNEADGIGRSIDEIVHVMEQLPYDYEVLVVDDGSHDDTLARARAAADRHPRVRVIPSPTNLGKGSALVRGALASVGELTLFVDADLEVHPEQLTLLLQTLVDERADVVIGSKLHPDARIDYPLSRRILSFGYYLLVRTFFRLPVHDTQTGLKVYRHEVLLRVAPRLLVKRFAHDLEALVNANRLGYKIVEAPVVVTRQRPFPRIGMSDVWDVALDTAAIWHRTFVLRYYDKVGVHVDALLAETPPFASFVLDDTEELPRELQRREIAN